MVLVKVDKKPKYFRTTGYMYDATDPHDLRKFHKALHDINEKYKNFEIQDAKPLLNKTKGIIGWDIPWTPSKWVLELYPELKTPNMYNPKYEGSPPRIIFGRASFTPSASLKFINFLQQKQPSVWNNINNEFIYSSSPKLVKTHGTGEESLHKFIMDDTKRVTMCAWAKHARVMYKCKSTKTLCIIDPWKQKVRLPVKWKNVIMKCGYTTTFVQREAEQGIGEGSCVLMSFVRLLMISKMGDKGATIALEPTHFDYIVLVSKLKRSK